MDDNRPYPAAGAMLPAAPAPLAGAPRNAADEDDSDLIEAIRRQLAAMLPEAPDGGADPVDTDPIATVLADFARDLPAVDLSASEPPRLDPPDPLDPGKHPAATADADTRTADLLGELNRLWRRGAN